MSTAAEKTWKEIQISEDQIHWKLGTFDLIIRNSELDLVVGVSNKPENVESSSENFNDSMLTWQRWIKPQGCKPAVKIQPKLPDRPLVVTPIDSISIPYGEIANFFVSVPMFLDISIGRDNDWHKMLSVPTEVLSDTWFGSPVDGIYCYQLRSKARRDIKDSPIKSNRVICPIQIENKSSEMMIFTNFCIHMKFLNIYQVGKDHWTNQVNIKFHDSIRGSSIDYTQDVLPEWEMIQACEEKAPTNFISKTFNLS